MEEAISEARRLAGKNMLPPRFIIEATLTQMRRVVATPPGGNPFVTTFVKRVRAGTAVSAKERTRRGDEAAKIVDSQIYPAWQKAVALLEPLVMRANNDAGLWRFKDGSEAYAHFLRRFTTTDLTPDQIHEIGLREVARIEKEMDTILREL